MSNVGSSKWEGGSGNERKEREGGRERRGEKRERERERRRVLPAGGLRLKFSDVLLQWAEHPVGGG